MAKAKKAANSKTSSKKKTSPAKKKGLLGFLFSDKKPGKKLSAKESKPKVVPKKSTPSSATKTPKKTLPSKPAKTSSKTSIKTTMEPAKIPSTSKKVSSSIKEPPKEEYVVVSSYEPIPFQKTSIALKSNKILTAEGWKHLFEQES